MTAGTGGGGPWAYRQTVPYLRLQAGGWMGSASGEIWSCTLKLAHFAAGSNLTTGTDNAAVIAAEPNLAGWATTIALPAWTALVAGMFDPSVALTYIKLNAYNSDDHQLSDPTNDHQITAFPGAGPTGDSPWAVSVTAEHRSSARSRGLGAQGRLALPVVVTVDRGTGKINGIGGHQVAAMNTVYLNFIQALEMPSGTGASFYPSIVSTLKAADTRVPIASKITTIGLSDIPGETRSRQNKLKRGSTLTTVTYA